MLRIQNLINGEMVDPRSGDWLDNEEPATGQVFSQVPDSDQADVDDAVQAATAAFPGWSRLPNDVRAGHLHKLANNIDQHAEELAALESRDNGKPLSLARTVDIPRASLNLRFFAGLVSSAGSESHATPEGINYTLRQPLGSVACISPWNLPIYLLTWKIAPALAVGNCVVAKPTEVTPATAHRLSELAQESGLPAGVLNVVHGRGPRTGEAVIQHPGIRAISFTGGTTTGRRIASAVAPTFKKLALEMGGKNPNLVFADCHFEKALATTVRSSFSNQGQICLCGSRIYVEKSLYPRFRDALVQRASELRVGDPQEPETQVGAMVSRPHYEKVLGCIERAVAEGGQVLCGGGAASVPGRCADGYFIQPTVIEGLPLDCQTNQEEIFGPVVTIHPFDSEEDAIALANGTPYGLSATVWTSDIGRGHRVAAHLDAGVVWINAWLVRDLRTPFGGFKQSGVGREGGLESLRFWTQPKNIYVSYRP